MDNEAPVLDWSRSARVRRDPSRCVSCGDPTILWNPDGDPQHKTCAEQQLHDDDAAAARYYGNQAQGVI